MKKHALDLVVGHFVKVRQTICLIMGTDLIVGYNFRAVRKRLS